MIKSIILIYNFFIKRSNRELFVLVIFGYSLFVGTILIIFVPTGAQMDATGFSIAEFQNAWTSTRMDEILSAWSNIMDVVIIQLLGDYIFILGGYIGNSAIFLLFAKNLLNSSVKFAQVGLIFTFFSRFADTAENFFSFFIILDPDSYLDVLVPLVSLLVSIKFLFVLLVYVMMLLCFGLFLYYTFLAEKK